MMADKEQKSKWLQPFRTIGIKKERAYFLENLAMLTSSGMSIFQALDSIQSDLRTSRMKKAVQQIRDDVQGGSMLWDALDKTALFPNHVISLIQIGEKAGRLPENIQVVAEQEKKERVFRSKLYSAMMYPVFVLLLTLIIGVGIAWFILPNLASVFSSMRMDLPLVTQWLISAGTFLGEYGIYVIPIFLLLVFVGLFFIFLFPATKHIGRTILFHVPGTKKIIQQVELSRFGYLLGSLLGAGVVVTDSLRSLARATSFSAYRDFYSELEKRIGEGESFEAVITSYEGVDKLMSSPIQGMIMSAENSGNLPETLQSIGRRFEDKLETSTKNLTVILEPVLLFIVWIAVVGVALAVILPIYSLIGDFNSDGVTAGGQATATEQVDQDSEESVPMDIATTSTATTSTATATETAVSEDIATSTDGALGDEFTSQTWIEINETGLGYLNVRSGPSTADTIEAQVTPGDTYEYIDTDGIWYQIKLDNKRTGWVYGEYVTELTDYEE